MCRVTYFIGLLTLALVETIHCDFTYPDFNQTLGLVFNGDASISSCSSKHLADKSTQKNPDSVDAPRHQAVGVYDGLQLSQTVESHFEADEIPEFETGFGDRSSTLKNDGNLKCSRRLRLTPSAPSKAGSVFYEKRVPVVCPLIFFDFLLDISNFYAIFQFEAERIRYNVFLPNQRTLSSLLGPCPSDVSKTPSDVCCTWW